MDKLTLNRESSVLLVIDIQERLLPAMKYGDQVLKKTSTLIAVAKTLTIPILVTEQYPKGLGKTVPELAMLLNSEETYEKTTFSGCTTELIAYLEKTGRKKIIISGMETHVCVFQTVRELLIMGYQVFVAGDAVCSRTKANHFNGLSLMTEMGAVVSNTETIFFDLLKKAGTPEFRELSKLIK